MQCFVLDVNTHSQHQERTFILRYTVEEHKFHIRVWVTFVTCMELNASACMTECSTFVLLRLTVFSTLACMRMMATTAVL